VGKDEKPSELHETAQNRGYARHHIISMNMEDQVELGSREIQHWENITELRKRTMEVRITKESKFVLVHFPAAVKLNSFTWSGPRGMAGYTGAYACAWHESGPSSRIFNSLQIRLIRGSALFLVNGNRYWIAS
jgi:hypothetical protein